MDLQAKKGLISLFLVSWEDSQFAVSVFSSIFFSEGLEGFNFSNHALVDQVFCCGQPLYLLDFSEKIDFKFMICHPYP